MKKDPQEKHFMETVMRTIKSFLSILPRLLAVILLLGLFKEFVPMKTIASFFTGNVLRDTFLGSMFGSISAGNPINSYIIGGELLKHGISLFAVTAFITAWVTVGIIQLPLEISVLGSRFSIMRNVLCLFLSFIVAIATVLTLGVIQ